MMELKKNSRIIVLIITSILTSVFALIIYSTLLFILQNTDLFQSHKVTIDLERICLMVSLIGFIRYNYLTHFLNSLFSWAVSKIDNKLVKKDNDKH